MAPRGARRLLLEPTAIALAIPRIEWLKTAGFIVRVQCEFDRHGAHGVVRPVDDDVLNLSELLAAATAAAATAAVIVFTATTVVLISLLGVDLGQVRLIIFVLDIQ